MMHPTVGGRALMRTWVGEVRGLHKSFILSLILLHPLDAFGGMDVENEVQEGLWRIEGTALDQDLLNEILFKH